jgi:hypothetical protein
MNALPKKFLPLTLFAIAVTSLFFVQPAKAFTMTIEQVGSNVVANGSGAFNLTGLGFLGTPGGVPPQISASLGFIATGSAALADLYRGLTGPSSFGSGGLFLPNTNSGDFFRLEGTFGELYVPHGYMSGAALSDSMTFNNKTFASLGLTPGTYEWMWGTGPNQNFTLIIGGAGVPDGGSTVSLLGFGLLGLAGLRRKLGC